MSVQTYPKKSGVKLSDHFICSEFDCPCDFCSYTLVDALLLVRLARVRESLGAPLRINSGYRCHQYQEALRLRGYETASGLSQHELGRAVDVMLAGDREATGAEIEKAARKAGFLAVGVGHNWCHLDMRDDKERRWVYVKR